MGDRWDETEAYDRCLRCAAYRAELAAMRDRLDHVVGLLANIDATRPRVYVIDKDLLPEEVQELEGNGDG